MSTTVAGPLVRVSDGDRTYEGAVVSLSRSQCTLMDRQSRLFELDVSQLKSFEKLSEHYQPYSVSAFRSELQAEFGAGYEVAATGHYLVCGPSGRVQRYAQLFESIYRDVEHFYRVRGFQSTTPEAPLVAVVFRTREEFMEYCVRDGVPPSFTLMGYYSLLTNRVALYDDAELLGAIDVDRLRIPSEEHHVAALAAISGTTANTVIHETTHQVGYNIGAHSRLGGTPIWVVEGLATVLEAPGMRKRQGRQLDRERTNPERANWFDERHRPERQMGNLAKLVASDQYFYHQTLNSYSEAWAFTFFLLENPARHQEFMRYLQKIRQRDPKQPYSAKDRLVDFQAAFGDISRLEVEFIRFMDRR